MFRSNVCSTGVSCGTHGCFNTSWKKFVGNYCWQSSGAIFDGLVSTLDKRNSELFNE